ncbi:MAG TPA: PAS domain S-box protein, partial [Phycisphaerales bacterium]|nr:PAS domain S-box protein [Phycisphaerales bacterium]
VVRNTELQHFIRRALDSAVSVEDRLVLHDSPGAERHLQVSGAPLRDEAGQKIGVLIVLNDITQIHRLEQLRRDFVANVSHELKTPVTSIKGFIETLLDGAMDNPDDRRRFLEIIARQAHRLDSIIDDLLTLSRLEQQSKSERAELAAAKIRPILTAAADLCQVFAAEKNIPIEIDCPDDLEGRVNASLCEQAAVNLVDNAIKYSDAGRPVRLEAERVGEELLIRVRDHGCGIAADHLPRLFERFYRVDKARSRKLGGTGLGLAIVKHIAQFHNGRITVESQLNQGSVFTLYLPQRADQGGSSDTP